MEVLSAGFIAAAFIAGLVTFLAPCTLPLIPAYLGLIAGVSQRDLSDPVRARAARVRLFVRSVGFVLGFSAVFIALGVLVGFAGAALAAWQEVLVRVAGVFVILLGVAYLAHVPLPWTKRRAGLPIPHALLSHPLGASAAGVAFALGWSPCIGPVLGAVLLVAATSTTAAAGAILLAIFSLGLAIPFLLVSLAYVRAAAWLPSVASSGWLTWVSGLFLIALGALLLFDSFGLLISWGFGLFEFAGYERIQQLL